MAAQQEQMLTQEEDTGEPAEEADIQAMEKAYKPPSQRKFKGRTGGITPDWHDKSPDEERDIDEWAEARSKNSFTLSKNWVDALNEKGFTVPIIKEVSPDMTKIWFIDSNTDYVANLSGSNIVNIEKAMFGDATRFSRNKQSGPKATKPTEVNIDEED